MLNTSAIFSVYQNYYRYARLYAFEIELLTSESQIRTTESSPALIMVLFNGPQTALFILCLPLGALIVSTDSLVSEKYHHRMITSKQTILLNEQKNN